MKDGFIKVAAALPALAVADCRFNTAEIIRVMRDAEKEKIKLLVFPELCITGYSCSDLFSHDNMTAAAEMSLCEIVGASAGADMLVFVGLPVEVCGKLYNCAAAVYDGRLLGLIPKTYLPNYNEFYELRHFTPASRGACVTEIDFAGHTVPFGTDQLFCHRALKELVVGAEICEDVWGQLPPSVSHCMAGATVMVNLSASPETIGKPEYRQSLIGIHSARHLCGYIYASAGENESTTDLIYSGHSVICENGVILAERAPFDTSRLLVSEIDVRRLVHERRKTTDYESAPSQSYRYTYFGGELTDTKLTRKFDMRPFVPGDAQSRAERCKFILEMQSAALAKRIRHTGCKTAVIGISGGLDSTLALLVAVRAFERIGKPRGDIVTVTMPCFGTGSRTKGNAEKLCEYLGTDFYSIDIAEAVSLHLRDIGHSGEQYDIAFENAQARERTQVLMDIANKRGGLVIGTGDLSEMALGWSTYNGDHMSMYGVNCSVPKTLVRYLVAYYADNCGDDALSKVLYDILDTPVSPELIPSEAGKELSQRTEEIIGSYDLHDFFLYYFVRCGFAPEKILRIAQIAFAGKFEDAYIKDTLRTFIKRFFTNQFKRSCTPDGVKIGSVSLSPRGDWRMPSDACCGDWLDKLN